MPNPVLDAFNEARGIREAEQQRQNAQGMANTQGKIENAFMSAGDPAPAPTSADGISIDNAPLRGAPLARDLAMRSGDAGLMQGVQQRQQGIQQATRDQDGQRNDRLGQFATGLAATPVAQRGQAFDAIVPELFSYGLTPDQAVDIRNRLVDPNQSDAVIAAYMSRSVSPDTMFEATAPQMQGQNEARVAYSGGVATQTLNPLGQQIASETARSNMAGEGINSRNAATNARNADTRAATEARNAQGGSGPEWTTLTPQQVVEAGYNEGDVIQRNSRTGQEVRRSADRIGSFNIGQTNAAGFAARMLQAGEILNSLEDPESGFDPSSFTRELGPFSGQNQRSYRQAQENWVSANLRRESGAAIPESELANEIRKYFPQPGDGPDVIAQRRAARTLAERAMVQGSQGAYEALVGSDPQGAGQPANSNQDSDPLGIRN
jgi:hypothetical protein